MRKFEICCCELEYHHSQCCHRWPICFIQLCHGGLYRCLETAVYSLVCGTSDERYGCFCIYKSFVAFAACIVIVGQSVMSATVTWLVEGSPPCSWESLLGEGLLVSRIWFLSWVTGVIIWAVVISVWVFSLHFHVLLGMWPSSHSAGVWIWSAKLMPWRSIGWLWVWSTVIWWLTSQRSVMCGWSVMWLVWCVMVRSVAVSSVGWVRSLWAASVVAEYIPLLWSRAASMWITMTWALMSSVVGLNWTSLVCLDLHSGALNLIWYDNLCVSCDVLLEFQKEVFCVGSPWQYDHICCIHST